jgi:hypothetical protein
VSSSGRLNRWRCIGTLRAVNLVDLFEYSFFLPLEIVDSIIQNTETTERRVAFGYSSRTFNF